MGEKAASKIEGGLHEAIELVRRAKGIDPDAWDGTDDAASVARRKAAIWNAARPPAARSNDGRGE